MTLSLRALLSGIVDYAGLFPPATLDMQASVADFAAGLKGDRGWMMGRFVVPVARLDEFLTAAAEHKTAAGVPWCLSAIIGKDVRGDFARVAAFNESHDGVAIDSAEVCAGSVDDVAAIADATPAGVRTFVEVPVIEDPQPFVKAIRSARLRAKVRTGGVVADAIPSVDDVARFIRRCYASDVPFKATAGLHHPIRGTQALTYEAGSASATMHGFLNVFLAAAFCFNGIGAVDAPRLLALDDTGDLSFDDDGVAWEDYRISTAEIERIRRRFAISFGSCSFTEPVEDLRSLGLMD